MFLQSPTLSPSYNNYLVCFVIVCFTYAAGIPKLPNEDAEYLSIGGDLEIAKSENKEQLDVDELLHEESNLLKHADDSVVYSDRGLKILPSSKDEDKEAVDVSDLNYLLRPTVEFVRNDGDDQNGITFNPDVEAAMGDVAPKYMLELYKKFSNDKYSHPIADIVRSFTNSNPGIAPIWTVGNTTRIGLHTLLFNISSISRDEDIHLAELRLYTPNKTERILVYEVVQPGSNHDEESRLHRYQLVTIKDIRGGHGDWETFSVTEVVRRWVRTHAISGHILEVRVDTKQKIKFETDEEKELDETQQRTNESQFYDPILVVFSNDRKRRKIELRELHEIQVHEHRTPMTDLEADNENNADYYFDDDYEEDYEGIVPAADDNREVVPDDNDDEKQTTKADENRLYSTNLTKNDKPESIDHENMHTKMILESFVNSAENKKNTTTGSHVNKKLSRVKRNPGGRNKKRRAKRNSCRRKAMYVNFSDIQWEKWIIEPRGYQAYECTGQCYFPLGDHLTPTKYAMIKSLFHATYPKKTTAVCCVPTRLEPISLLYRDEQGTVTYKYKYDGMVVAECGCR